jgi:hypothetical protein
MEMSEASKKVPKKILNGKIALVRPTASRNHWLLKLGAVQIAEFRTSL